MTSPRPQRIDGVLRALNASAAGPLLDQVGDPAALRCLPERTLPALAAELRAFLLASVATSGGHLAAGLGTVELAIALHYVFDTPADDLVWDIGHQAYPHKILTGRRGQLAGIRKRGGLSGFLKRDESRYDAFGGGHCSTAISAALGMAVASARAGSAAKAVAVIGDGALTAGMAYEALNHAGATGADLLVVFNDNGMSISPNVGALAGGLQRPATADGFFRALGFDYEGPVDGHDLAELLPALRTARAGRGPRVLHVRTRKGAGYARAEADPVAYHGVTPFDPAAGLARAKPGHTFTSVFGQWLCEAAGVDPRVHAVTPAMREGSGLVDFERLHPRHYHDVGIAEQHAVTFAAGLACKGLRPVVAIYSTFLQRGYDQLVHDVMLQRLPVLFAIDRAGLVGPDGATHNGSYDLTLLRCLPGLVVMTPSDGDELRDLLATGLAHDGPAAVRYPRTAVAAASDRRAAVLPLGQARTRRHGHGVALLAFGPLVGTALSVADTLDATVIDMRFVKPLDERAVLQAARQHALVVTLEENAAAGGAGAAVLECLAAHGVAVDTLVLGLPDRPIEHGTREQVLAEAGLDHAGVLQAVCARLNRMERRGAEVVAIR